MSYKTDKKDFIDETLIDYEDTSLNSDKKSRLNVNKLIKRVKDERDKDKKLVILITLSISAIAIIIGVSLIL